eukprot:COSAG02_NODE_2012_length_10118_cov_7.152111_5_plen_97_part_00
MASIVELQVQLDSSKLGLRHLCPLAAMQPERKHRKCNAREVEHEVEPGRWLDANVHETDGGLDLAGGERLALGVRDQLAGLAGDAVEDVVHERVHD